MPRGFDLDVFLDGTIILFALVIITEPITSSIIGKWKYGYGLIIGLILMFLDSLALSFSFDHLLASLLITNLIVIASLKFTQILSKPKNLESSN